MPLNPVPAGYEPLVNPSGELVYTPKQNVKPNLEMGYRLPTQEDLSNAALKKEYGEGIGNEILAGVEGALSGATFGLSRHVENILGVDPQAQAARKQFNPASALTGEFLGIGGSLLIPGSPAARVAGLGAKAGLGAAEVVTSQAAKQIAAKTIGSALEGLAYGAAQPISESALGDPTLTAQKAFHQIGLGALLGGAIGGVTSSLGVGAKRMFAKSLTAPKAPEVEVILGEATPQGPVKLEGTIDFGIPDEKILKQAERLSPGNPLRKNDLEWLKANGAPVDGKPTIFEKIGTEELPTLNSAAQGQVTVADTVKSGMQKLKDTSIHLDGLKENILRDSGLTLKKADYISWLDDEIAKVQKSGMAGDEIGQQAIKRLEATKEAAENLPEVMDAVQIKQRLDSLRQSGKIYTKSGGLKDDFVSDTYRNLEHRIDKHLKANLPEYKALMEEYAPLVNLQIDLEKHLKWDWDLMESGLKSDWIDNRIVKPFQSELYGNKGGGLSADANLLREFGKFAGVDLDKAVKANLVYGKINPTLAEGSQRGTWGAQVAEGIGQLAHPTEVPGKILKGTAKVALTGELPEFVQNIRARGIRDVLLGKSSPGVADRILSKMGALDVGSKLLALPRGTVPLAVTSFLEAHELDEADQKLEVLTALEKAQRKADLEIQGAVTGIFSGKKAPSKTTDAFTSDDADEVSKQINELVSDPNLLMDRLTKSMGSLGTAAPQIASGLNMTTIRAVNFLAEKVKPLYPTTLPLDPKTKLSREQLYSLGRTIQYIQSPYLVLKDIQSGMTSMEGKEVLQRVYPELYQDMKAKVMAGIADMQSKGKTIPASKKLGLSFFLGQPLTSSQNVRSMQITQQAFQNPVGTQNAPNPRPSSAKHLEMSTRAQTPLQKIAGK